MMSIVFFTFAAICNAVMDICTHHFYQSAFNSIHCNTQWWNNEGDSWMNKYVDRNPMYGRRKIMGSSINYPVQLTDAWHFFKMLMILFLAGSVITFCPEEISISNIEWLNLLIAFIGYGVLWNCTFSLFYNKILRK